MAGNEERIRNRLGVRDGITAPFCVADNIRHHQLPKVYPGIVKGVELAPDDHPILPGNPGSAERLAAMIARAEQGLPLFED